MEIQNPDRWKNMYNNVSAVFVGFFSFCSFYFFVIEERKEKKEKSLQSEICKSKSRNPPVEHGDHPWKIQKKKEKEGKKLKRTNQMEDAT